MQRYDKVATQTRVGSGNCGRDKDYVSRGLCGFGYMWSWARPP